MLEVTEIKAVYNGVVLGVSEVSLTVPEQTAVALLGNNGSGKSTTLKSISGVLGTEDGKLTEGHITLDGRRIDRMEPEQAARLGVSHVLQGRSVFTHLTAEENLLMGAYTVRDRKQVKTDLAMIYDYFPALARLKDRVSGYLSGGEQQMLVIGRAIMSRPRLLLLDEPSLGLAFSIVRDIYRILKTIKEEHRTSMLIAEQNIAAAMGIADYCYLLQNGKVASGGTPQEMLEQGNVKEAYLHDSGDFFSYHR